MTHMGFCANPAFSAVAPHTAAPERTTMPAGLRSGSEKRGAMAQQQHHMDLAL